jgi:hypothetical protein
MIFRAHWGKAVYDVDFAGFGVAGEVMPAFIVIALFMVKEALPKDSHIISIYVST